VRDFKFCPMCRGPLSLKNIDGRARLTCGSCGWIHYLNPVPAVACFVEDENGNVLLVKRGVEPQKGKWSLPAGFVEIDETPAEAAVRELEEETGICGEADRLIGVYLQESKNYGSVLTVGYSMKIKGGTLAAGSDVTDVRFSPVNNVEKIPFESHREILKVIRNEL